jgi:hypothetical protein
MSPKQRFNFLIEPGQLAVLKRIEETTGAKVSEQIRRAIQAYLESQSVLPKAEVRRLIKGE